MQILTLAITTAGSTAGLAALLAQAAPSAPGLASYVGEGAGVLAVGALAEVTRRLLNGRLVPRESRESEQELAAYITAAGQREDRLMRLVEENHAEARRVAEIAEELRAEIRVLRRGQER